METLYQTEATLFEKPVSACLTSYVNERGVLEYKVSCTIPQFDTRQIGVVADFILDIAQRGFQDRSHVHRMMYLPSTQLTVTTGSGYINAFYPRSLAHATLDVGYETDDNEIGKGLAQFLIAPSEDGFLCTLVFYSPYTFDEHYQLRTIWSLGEHAAFDHILDCLLPHAVNK